MIKVITNVRVSFATMIDIRDSLYRVNFKQYERMRFHFQEKRPLIVL